MKIITVRRLDLQFDADQITGGTNEAQTDQAIEAINLVLQREPFGLGAQLLAYPEEIEIEATDHPIDQQP
jgi:molybdopterin biosynthesis enzyme MoaB